MRPSTNYDNKHNDMKWNIFYKHTYLYDEDEDDDKILNNPTTTSPHV